MNILVTGSNGQLGSELKRMAAADRKYNWYFTDVDELDITNKDRIEGLFSAKGIDICINCAAYTAVDKAEEEVDKAMMLNTQAVEYLADACYANHALLLHISTDYVFNGENFIPYTENDSVNATSAYGRTKAEGEKRLTLHKCRSIIIRTSWLYSAFGHNFVKTMLKLGQTQDRIEVVADQIGSPTWAFDLAWAIMRIIDDTNDANQKEIYHFSNEGAISWYDFAKAIMEIKQLPAEIIPIPSTARPSTSKRPYYSLMSKEKFKQKYGLAIPYWKDSLIKCLNELNG